MSRDTDWWDVLERVWALVCFVLAIVALVMLFFDPMTAAAFGIVSLAFRMIER